MKRAKLRCGIVVSVSVSVFALMGCDDTSKPAADAKADSKSKDSGSAKADSKAEDGKDAEIEKGDDVVEAGAAGKAVQGGAAGPVPGM